MFIVSDFVGSPPWAEPLALLARRHEVVAVRLFDPLEIQLPDLELLVLQDADGRAAWIDARDQGFRGASPPSSSATSPSARGVGAGRGRMPRTLDQARLVEAVLRFPSCASGAACSPAVGCPRTWRARMSFLWPDLLSEISPCPRSSPLRLAAAAAQARGRALRDLSMVRQALGSRAAFHRRVPPILFLLAITLMRSRLRGRPRR